MEQSKIRTLISYEKLLVFSLAVSCVIAVISPRFLAYWPGLIGISGLFYWRFVYGTMPIIPQKILVWALAFLFLAGLSSLWAQDAGYVLSRTIKAALILLPGAALAGLVLSLPEEKIRIYSKMIVWGAIGAAAICGMDMAFGFPLYKLLHGLDTGAEVSPSVLNRSVIALLAFFFMAAGIAAFHKDKKLIISLALSYGTMLFFTDSQSAQLGFIMAGVFYIAWLYKYKWAWRGLAGLLAGAVLAAPFLSIWMFDHLAFTMTELPFFGRGAGFGAERLEIWDKISRYALRHPFYGFGMEATRFIDDFDTAQIFRQGITELHPHNFAVQLWIEFGFIGAALGAGFMIFIMRLFGSLGYEQARMALPCFIILASAAAFGYGLWQGWFLGLIMLCVSIAIIGIRLYEKDSAGKDSCNPEKLG